MTRYYLIPKNVRNLTPDATESLSVAFDGDLACKGDFWVEIDRWRLKVVDHQNVPGLQSALKPADKDLYPNIHTIFNLVQTLALGLAA